MSSAINDFVDIIEAKIPDIASATDLVNLGLFPSRWALAQQRTRGTGPEFLKLGQRTILYPKEAVIAWLRDKAKDSQSRFPPNKTLKPTQTNNNLKKNKK